MEYYRQFCYPSSSHTEPYLRRAPRVYLSWRVALEWGNDLESTLFRVPRPEHFMHPPESLAKAMVDLNGSLSGIDTLIRSRKLTHSMRDIRQEHVQIMESLYDLLIELAKTLRASKSTLMDGNLSSEDARSVFRSSAECLYTAAHSLSQVALSLQENSSKFDEAFRRRRRYMERFVDIWENQKIDLLCTVILALSIAHNANNINIQLLSTKLDQIRVSLSIKEAVLLGVVIGIFIALLSLGNIFPKTSHDSSKRVKVRGATDSTTLQVFDVLDSMANIDLYWMNLHDLLVADDGTSQQTVQMFISTFGDHTDEVLKIATTIQSVFPIKKKGDAPLLVHPVTERLRARAAYSLLRTI